MIIKKQQTISIIFVVVLLLACSSAFAVDKSLAASGAELTVGASGNFSQTPAGWDPSEGGNITKINLTSTASSVKWGGYIGSVDANLLIGEDTDVLYNFGSVQASQIKSVFASTDLSFGFGALAAANKLHLDTVFSWDGQDADSANNTYDDGTATIAQVSGVSIVNLTVLAGGPFQSGIFNDGSNSVIQDFAFGVRVVPDSTSFNNVTVDYQLIVPVNSSGVGGTLTYYFFLDVE